MKSAGSTSHHSPCLAIETEQIHPGDRRSTLLGQLEYLVDEIEALEEVIGRVPEGVLSGRPTGHELSIKELYGILALADEEIFPDYIEAMVEGEEPKLSVPDDKALAAREAWEEAAIEDILARLRQARAAIVEQLRDLPEEAWDRRATADGVEIDLYGLARYIAQRDTTILRVVGTRLHESRLTDGPQDLPK